MQKSEKKIEKNFFCTKKSEIFSATRCCLSFFDTMLGSYFINKIRYIIKPDGRIVWKIIAGDRIWCRAQVMVSRCFANKVDLGTSQIDVKPSRSYRVGARPIVRAFKCGVGHCSDTDKMPYIVKSCSASLVPILKGPPGPSDRKIIKS